MKAFIEFGPVRVEWPGREAASPPRGYLYIVFEDEDRVKELLGEEKNNLCTHFSRFLFDYGWTETLVLTQT